MGRPVYYAFIDNKTPRDEIGSEEWYEQNDTEHLPQFHNFYLGKI